jgi:hypothetical protein
MMRLHTSAAVIALAVAGAAGAAPAPSRSPEPVKAEEFLQRCKKDWDFCRVRIQAQMTELNAVREACIPNDVNRDNAAVRIAYVLEEALEEDASLFETGEYKIFIGQIIALIWPCGVVS